MDINYIIFLLIFFISTLIIFRKFQILKENISYSEHKSLGKTNKSEPCGVKIILELDIPAI